MRLAWIMYGCGALVFLASVWRQEPLLTVGALLLLLAGLGAQLASVNQP